MSEWEEENEWEKAAATEKWDDKKNIRNVLGIFLMPLNKEAAKAVEGESSEKNKENKKHTVGRRWWKKEEKEEVKKKRFGGLSFLPRRRHCWNKLNSTNGSYFQTQLPIINLWVGRFLNLKCPCNNERRQHQNEIKLKID